MLQPSVGTCQVEQESPVYMLLVCLEQLSDAPLCCCKPSPRCHSTSLPWPTRPAALALAASLRPWALSPSLTVFQTHLGAKHVPASDPLHLPSPLSGKLSLSYPQGVSPSLHRGFLVRSCPSLCECQWTSAPLPRSLLFCFPLFFTAPNQFMMTCLLATRLLPATHGLCQSRGLACPWQAPTASVLSKEQPCERCSVSRVNNEISPSQGGCDASVTARWTEACPP